MEELTPPKFDPRTVHPERVAIPTELSLVLGLQETKLLIKTHGRNNKIFMWQIDEKESMGKKLFNLSKQILTVTETYALSGGTGR